MLQGSICPVTAVLAASGLAAAAYCTFKAQERPSAARFGALTALLFAAQMLNFPILHGTSGHLLGGVLAASLLGTPFGVLAVALVVGLQALVFADGGLAPLGANLVNMALLGAGCGGWLRARLARHASNTLATALAAWASVLLAAGAVSVELALDGQIAFLSVLPAMLASHALIGLGEALITLAACAAFARPATQHGGRALAPLACAALLALLASPYASNWPDGLEWVATRYKLLHASAPAFVTPLADYQLAALGDGVWATGLAGLAGVALSFAAAWLLARLLPRATT